MLHKQYYVEQAKVDKLTARKNQRSNFYNGIYDRYEYPVLTREFAPVHWRYDLDEETNPYFMERLGINAVMNSGAIELNGKYYLVVRVEGNDRKSFFAVAESESGIDGFRFWDYPVVLPDTCPEETNVYDMRLTKHEDGWIYGLFCSERKDADDPDLSAAVAEAGIVRTKDLKTWERLDNLKTLRSPQQRNVALHPEFVDGKYAFYTRPMDGFIETGSGGGIGFGLCEDICHAVIDEEKIISRRIYHTLTESKNGAGAPPIRGKKCWIHIYDGEKAVEWREHYKRFLGKLREKYPEAQIVCCTTLLRHDRAWDRAIGQAVQELGDDRITQYLFRRNGNGTPGHLRIPEAEEMAKELAVYIESLDIEGWDL